MEIDWLSKKKKKKKKKKKEKQKQIFKFFNVFHIKSCVYFIGSLCIRNLFKMSENTK